jgi:hypothetical protein
MATTSPNMNLVLSTVAVDSGLNWENNLNASLTTVDSHNHSSGQGVQINPAGININADLAFNANNATSARSLRFQPQFGPLSGGADIGCLYEAGVDLFYNDGSGNQIQITSGGSVNATSSGISSGTATASFSSGVLVVNAAVNKPANIQGGSLLLGNNVASSKYLTLSPPSAMASNFGLVLPSIPVSTSFMQLDSSGNMSASVATSGGITGSNIAAGTITASNLAASNFAQNTWSTINTSATSPTLVTDGDASITVSGNRPVQVTLQPINLESGTSFLEIANTGDVGFTGATLRVDVGSSSQYLTFGAANTAEGITWPVSFSMIFFPPAGTVSTAMFVWVSTDPGGSPSVTLVGGVITITEL